MEQEKKERIKNRIRKALGLGKGTFLYLPSLSCEQHVEPSLSAYLAFVKEVVEIAKSIRSISFVYTEDGGIPFSLRTVPVTLFVGRTPSAGFKILQGWFKRHANFELDPSLVRTESYSGKRNVKDIRYVTFLCHDDDQCRVFAQSLAEARRTRDIVEVKTVYFDDDSDRYRGRYEHESEYTGIRGYRLQVIIKTAAGKVKAERRLGIY